MFKHILVPLDGSHMAESVLPTVSSLAEKLNASVMLIHVIEKDAPQEVHGDVHLSNPSEAEAYLKKIISRDFAPHLKVDHHVHTSEVKDVPESIVQHAGEFEPDLIVMCTHGRSGPRDWLFGSIAQRVIALGKTPVLLVPPLAEKVAPFHCRKLLVPLDGNEDHEQGVEVAVRLAKECNTAIHLLMVVPTYGTLSGEWRNTSRLLPGATSKMLDMAEENGHEYMKKHRAILEKTGLSISSDVQRGEPAKIISDVAKELNADLIVLGTHGKTGMDAFWSGSVTPKVCRNCAVPLLLVPVWVKEMINS